MTHCSHHRMHNDNVRIIELEKHRTKDVKDGHVNGYLTVVWRNWDKVIKHPKMVYLSSVYPGEIKGPHLHTKRNSYFICIHGRVVFIVKDKNGKYKEIESSEDNPIMIFVPKNLASAHLNLSDGISQILALADLAWRPDDNEMKNISFNDYDWTKWKKR